MDQQPSELSTVLQGESRGIEQSFASLWDRVRRAAEIILQLREEKKLLTVKVEQLELELQQVRQELEVRNAYQPEKDRRQDAVFSNGEKEAIAERVRGLLAKLDAYL